VPHCGILHDNLAGTGEYTDAVGDSVFDLLNPPNTMASLEVTASPGGMTEQELQTGLSLMGAERPKINALMLGFSCDMDEAGQVVVVRVLQESPAAYSGQVGIGDVVEAVDSRLVTSLQHLAAAADGRVRVSSAACVLKLLCCCLLTGAPAAYYRRRIRWWRWSCAGKAALV